MPKRRTHDSYDAEDNPIGLTGAFAPVKGPQSVEYDTTDDPVGLTQAFEPLPDQNEPRAWDEAGKWKDFDWDAVPAEPATDYGDEFVKKDESDAAEKDDAEEALFQQEPAETASTASVASASATAAAPQRSGSGRARHAAPEKQMSERMRKSQRTRRILVVLLIILVLVIAAVVFFGYRAFSTSQQEAAQQTQEQATTHDNKDIGDTAADDAMASTTKLADVPKLTDLLGKTQDEAIALIGRGGIVTSNREVNEEGNPIKTTLNVALTEEPADSKTGTPTVYLGLNEEGIVRQVGYSASASALGFGSLSFADAVNNEHVIEKTLAKIGVDVPEGTAVLPANKDEYSTYASDGTTVLRERCSFEGDVDLNGAPYTWSAVLSYDYTTQVVTGNLNDTVRVIYVYITAK